MQNLFLEVIVILNGNFPIDQELSNNKIFWEIIRKYFSYGIEVMDYNVREIMKQLGSKLVFHNFFCRPKLVSPLYYIENIRKFGRRWIA